MQNKKYIGIIGSRTLPQIHKNQVKGITKYLINKGYGIASGGAIGADLYALESLLELNAIERGIIFSPWKYLSQFPQGTQPQIKKFFSLGGKIVLGNVSPYDCRNAIVAGLLSRNVRLVSNVTGIVAFLHGESRGTIFTIKRAISQNIPVVVFSCDNRTLPNIDGGSWKRLNTKGCWLNSFTFLKLRAFSFPASNAGAVAV